MFWTNSRGCANNPKLVIQRDVGNLGVRSKGYFYCGIDVLLPLVLDSAPRIPRLEI